MNENREPRKVSLDELMEMDSNGLATVDAGGGVYDVYTLVEDLDSLDSEFDDYQLGEYLESVEVDYLEGLS